MRDRVYAAITADIVGSTDFYKTNGKPLRPIFLDVLAEVNRLHAAQLAVPFTVTLGDEVQGLVSDPADSPHVAYDLRLQLSPLKCRIGVGIGSVVSDLAESTTQMEGQAFSMSREALGIAERPKPRQTVYRVEDRVLESTANAMMLLIDAIQGRWTVKQWEAVRLYRDYNDLSRAGDAIGLAPQSIDDRLRPTHWRDVDEALSELSRLIGDRFTQTGETS